MQGSNFLEADMQLLKSKRLLLAFLLFAFVRLYAQQNSDITGIVTDPSGNVIPGAQVTITENSTGFTRTVTTDNAGLFNFPNLNIGTYSLQATASGFQNYSAKNIVLNVSRFFCFVVLLFVGSVVVLVSVFAVALL